MLAHTKKPLTESIKFYGSPQEISELRKLASTTGVIEVPADSIPAEEVSPEMVTNPQGVYLKGLRYREELTQVQVAELTGISRRHISEMKNGNRPIGKASARKLADVLHADYRVFL